MTKNPELAVAHLTFNGMYVDQGMMDIASLSESLRTFDTVFTYFKKELRIEEELLIRVGDIKKGSSDVNIYIQLAQTLANGTVPVAKVLAYAKIADMAGVFEVTRPIFKEMGELLKYKLFAQNNKVENTNDIIVRGNKHYVLLKNSQGEEEYFPIDIKKHERKIKGLEKLLPVVPGKIDNAKFGYERDDGGIHYFEEVNKDNHSYLKFKFENKEKEEFLDAKVRLIDDKTGNGKLWLDDDKQESVSFELDIEYVGNMEKIIRDLAQAEADGSLLALSGKKEISRDGKLVKYYISNIRESTTVLI